MISDVIDYLLQTGIVTLAGGIFGIALGILLGTDAAQGSYTPNKVIYDHNLTIPTVKYKEWVIEHEASLAIKELHND
jgi:hypothetical protein